MRQPCGVFAAAEHIGTLDMVLSVGWAGALDASVEPGRCYIPSEIIDVADRRAFFCWPTGIRRQRLVTAPNVADEGEKSRLRDSYGAALVDMEAAAITRLAQIRRIPVCCFKAVSDGPGAKLPDLNRFIDEYGQLRMLPFLAHVTLTPRYWGSLVQLGSTSRGRG